MSNRVLVACSALLVACGGEGGERSAREARAAADSFSHAAASRLRDFLAGEADSTALREAAAGFDSAAAIDSTRYLDQVSAATALYHLGRADEALRRVEAVVARREGYAEGMMLAGCLHERRGDAEGARRWYRQAADAFRARTGRPEAGAPPQEINLASALFLLGDSAEAARAMETARQKQPQSPAVMAVEEMLGRGGRQALLEASCP